MGRRVEIDALDLVRSLPSTPTPTDDVAKRFGVSPPTAHRILQEMAARGLVEHTAQERGPGSGWVPRWHDASACGTTTDAGPSMRTRLYAIPILNALRFRPKTAQQIASDLETPIAATYRILHALEALGLVVVFDRPLTAQGKRTNVYLATVAYAPNPNYARMRESKDIDAGNAVRADG